MCTPLLARAENIESIPRAENIESISAVTVKYPATTPTVVHVATLPAGETSMKPAGDLHQLQEVDARADVPAASPQADP